MFRFRHKAQVAILIVGLVALLAGALLLVYRYFDRPIVDNYEGTIVDKWAAYSHSEQGSFPYYRLLIESDTGKRFKVVVDYDIFRQAEIGMRIKRTKTGIELGTGGKKQSGLHPRFRLRNIENRLVRPEPA